MMKLFAAAGTCSICAHVILEELRLPHEVTYVTLLSVESPLLHVNKFGKVPTFILPDGEVVTQNGVILPYLGDLDPSRRLLPMENLIERRKVLQWVAFFNTDVHPALKKLTRPEHYCADPQGLRASFSAILEKYLALVNETLATSEWLTGDAMTIADIYAAFLWKLIERLHPSSGNYPHFRQMAARFEDRPAVKLARAMEAATPIPPVQ